MVDASTSAEAGAGPMPPPVQAPLPVRSADYALDDEEEAGGDNDHEALLSEKSVRTRPRSDSIAFDFSTRIIHLSESAEQQHTSGVPNEPIGIIAGIALIVGLQIGSGIFSSPGVVAKETGSVGSALLLWTGAGFLSWAGASSFAELGSALPMNGGAQAYLATAFGPLPAYCFSFTAVTALKPGSQDLCRLIYHTAFSLDPNSAARAVPTIAIKLTGIIAIVSVSAMQAWSSKAGTRAQLVLTVFKVLAIVLVFVGGLVFLGIGHGKPASDFSFGGSSNQPAGYALALFSALWTFDGWDQCNYVSKDCAPGGLPIIINSSLALVMCLFILANFSASQDMSHSTCKIEGQIWRPSPPTIRMTVDVDDAPADDPRLTKDVFPKHYALTIRTDLISKTLSGTCEITITLLSAIPALVLNVAAPLVLRSAVIEQNGVIRKASGFKMVEGRERVMITFEGGAIVKGEAKVGLRWDGELNRSMKVRSGLVCCLWSSQTDEFREKGYYLSAYPAKTGGGTDFYAVTQFQPTHARRSIFPHYPAPNPATKGEWELVHFRPTPPISSYIVAYANGDFERNGSSINGVELGFYATHDNIKQTNYALELTKRVLPIYEKLFDIKYPLRKLDTLVVSDFDLGYGKLGQLMLSLFYLNRSFYLKKHLYGNATTEALWQGIAEASGKDVPRMMTEWTTKVGFPVITVEETATGLKIRQNRFLSTGAPTPEQDETLWHVPLGLLTIKDGKANVDRAAVLTTRERAIPLEDVRHLSYKLNSDNSGVYRVSYSAERLAKLGDEAGKKDSCFSTSDRVGLVGDAIVLAASGHSKTSGALSLISKLGHERENLVWGAVHSALSKLSNAWWEQDEQDRKALRALGLRLFSPVAKSLSFKYSARDEPDVTELRTLSISYAADCGDPAILKEYRTRFDTFLHRDDESDIPSDLRRSIFSHGVGVGGKTAYDKILSVYLKPATPSHRSAAIAALCSSEDDALLDRTLALILSDDVKTQDIAAFFAYLSSNTSSRRKLWEFFQTNYGELMQRFKGNFQLSRIISSSFGSFSSKTDLDRVAAFFQQKDTTPYAPSLRQTLDAVQAKIAWLERDGEDVHQWLKSM
ncbi:hypothetical protein P7C70_g1199, partial [Phenoliferia sp. Uapishka_3]